MTAFEWALGVFAVFVFFGVGYAACYESRSRDRFMFECEADGNKHYQCEERWRIANPPPVRVHR